MSVFMNNMYKADLTQYYDAMHQHTNYSLECQFAGALIQKYYPGRKRVLDICCGTGEHTTKMAQLGYEVTCVDSSQDMIKFAIKKTKEADVVAKFKHSDINTLEMEGKFQAAYCLGYTFNYMMTHPDVLNFIKAIKKALTPNGVFWVDFINGGGLIRESLGDKFVYQHEGVTIFQFEQAPLDRKRRVKHIEFYYLIDHHDGRVKTIFAEEDLRIFFGDEVQMLMSTCGFDHVESFYNYSLDAATSGISDIVIVTS